MHHDMYHVIRPYLRSLKGHILHPFLVDPAQNCPRCIGLRKGVDSFPHIPSAAPIILRDRKILSIDGGCSLKVDGQLNALVIPGEGSEDFSWTAWDGLPGAVALDPQEASPDPVNIRWGRSALEVLEPGEETTLCRHLETGRVLPILNRYLRRRSDGTWWCEDSTDYALPVSPGDRLHVVARIKGGALCKKAGVTGWYYGRLRDTL